MLGLILVLGAPTPASAAGRRGLTAVSAEPARIDRQRAELSDRCREQVRDELRRGQRKNDACREDREILGRAVVRARDDFGFVERRQVDLASLRLTLGLARRCRQWPLRDPDRDVLRRPDVDEALCRLRRYQGPLPLTFIDHQGRRHQPLPPVVTDRDGRVTLRFGSLDQSLRALGAGSLDDYARIELGEAAWAGHVDLEQLLRFRADWHLVWVTRGRGSPGLFAARHPEHLGSSDARTMTAEAQLARQLRDFQRVRAGQLPAHAYFDRYVRSPYHRQLRVWLRTRDQKPPGGRPPGDDPPTRP